LQLLILLYQREQNLPSWQMLMQDPSMFNEETGEMSFSILSRCVQGEQMAQRSEHLDNMYRIIPEIMSVEDDIQSDMSGNDGPKFNWRRVAKPECEEVEAVTAFMKGLCRSAAMGTAKQYEGKTAKSKCYKNKAEGNKAMVALDRFIPIWQTDIQAQLQVDLLTARTYTIANFGCMQAHIWPEMKYHQAVPPPGAPLVPLPAPGGQLDVDAPVEASSEDDAKEVESEEEEDDDEGDEGDTSDDDERDDDDDEDAGEVLDLFNAGQLGAGGDTSEENGKDEASSSGEGDDISGSSSDDGYDDDKADPGGKSAIRGGKKRKAASHLLVRSERRDRGNKGRNSDFVWANSRHR
jgi:hypothetical protein